MNDPLKDLPRLGDEALGPCGVCGKVMLATGLPLFFRLSVNHCGIDAKAVQQRAGLAMTMGGGEGGLALASVLGPQDKSVVVMENHEVNVCHSCASEDPSLMMLFAGDGE